MDHAAGRRMLALLAAVFVPAVLLTLVGSALGANASSISSASLTGGNGTYTNGNGTIYAKQGGQLTLAVGGSNIACVELSSGQKDAAAPFSFALSAGAGDGPASITVTAYPSYNANNGNCSGNRDAIDKSYQLDNTGPVVSASLNPTPNALGWTNADTSVTWAATDAGAGLASGPTPASDSQSANTSGVIKSATATDRVGNVGSGSVTVKLDKQVPTISASRSPAANGAGWNNGNVTVSISCADALSGIKSCTGGGTFVFDHEGAGQSLSASAVDNADNSSGQLVVNDVNIDKTAPSLSGSPTSAPNGSGWYSTDVAIHWTASDGLSGVSSTPADSTISGEGAGLYATQTVADRAGNSTTADSSKVSIDRHAPVTNASAPPAWNNMDVAVTLTGSDGLSGVEATYFEADGGSEQTYSPISKPSFSSEGVHTLEYWSVDNAGNVEQHHTIQVAIDKTPPTISHTLSPTANANGWNNSDVTVHFVCGDSASGIASCTDDKVVADEGAGQTVNGKAVDNAGNEVGDAASVSVDKTAPIIQASADRPANSNGWYSDDVIVGFACSDELSGVDTCPQPVTIGEGAEQAVSRSASDNAGNSASAGVKGVDVDKTAPSVSGQPTSSPNGNGWYSGDVVVHWSASDSLSGLDGSAPDDTTVTGEGANLSASAWARDRAGNVADATVSSLKIDRTAPITTASVDEPAFAPDWYGGNVKVTLTGHDSLSGIAHTYYRIDGGEQQEGTQLTLEGDGSHTVRYWSEDMAGNVEDEQASSLTVEIDATAPSIDAVVPPANSNGWYRDPVVVSFACADTGSGLKSCTGPTQLGEGAAQSVSGQAEDNVGNKASATASGLNVDLTPPAITGKPTTEPNANGWYSGDVAVHWDVSDALSGVASAPADSMITGEGANLGAGPVEVLDRAGNSANGTIAGIKIDRTKPRVDSIAASVNNDSAAVTVTASDALSGLDGVTVNGAAAARNAGGSYGVTVPLACGPNTLRVAATDRAGNPSNEATKTLTRTCVWVSNVLQPVATKDGSQVNATATNLSVFKIKSTVPVKFQLFSDAARTKVMTSPPAGAVAKLTFAKVDATTDSIDPADLVTGSANTGDLFRWTGSPDNQYMYNLSTGGQAAGTYYVQMTLYASDGTLLAQSAKQYLVLRS
jgi:hypothetical protein